MSDEPKIVAVVAWLDVRCAAMSISPPAGWDALNGTIEAIVESAAAPAFVAVADNGDVHEFAGWRPSPVTAYSQALPMFPVYAAPVWEPAAGPRIATAEDMGGEPWLAWLRDEGWLGS